MQRSTIGTIDASTKLSLYAASATEPAIALLLVTSDVDLRPGAVALVVVLASVHAVLCLNVLSRAMRAALGGAGLTRSQLATAATLTAVSMLLLGTTSVLAGGTDRTTFALAMLSLGAMTCAVAPTLQTSQILLATAVPAGAAALLQLGVDADFSARPLVGIWYGLCAGSAALTYKWSVWILTLVWDLHRSRDLEARLAVAEERLRFSRDLHDTLGRNLSLISITTELAARSSGSHETMTRHLDEIRLVCSESIRDMREVVHGYRGTDLATELAGARSLLSSAGVRTRIIGDFDNLPRDLQAALGWVVREAVTNIIRHSDATTARIELDVGTSGHRSERYVTLRIDNDGCRPSETGASPESGAGLAGLNERLRASGGTLMTRSEDGWFYLRGTLPVGRQQAADELQAAGAT